MKNNVNNCAMSCYGCGACVSTCPVNAIEYYMNKDGFYDVKIDEDKCINCGLCKKVCPKFTNTSKDIKSGKLLGCYTKDNKLLEKVTSGGIAYEIGNWGIKNNFYIIGTIYNYTDDIAEAIVTKDKNEFEKTKGSKYIQAKTDISIKRFLELCRESSANKFIVFGTPCQIAGYKNLIAHYKIKNEIYLIDLYCHGVPSYNVWHSYLTKFKKKKGISKITSINFRSKKDKWHNFVLEMSNDKKVFFEKAERNDFYKAFFDNILLNDSCFECKYRKELVSSDIRLGDFWGKKYSDNLSGVSAVSVFNEKGNKLLESIKDNIVINDDEVLEQFLAYQSMNNYANKGLRSKYIQKLNENSDLSKVITDYRKFLPKKYLIKENLKYLLSYLPINVKNKIKTKVKKR